MPRFIIKLDEYYFEWSTIVDAPVTYRMKLDVFKEYYRAEYGNKGMEGLPERLARVEKNGVSGYHPYDDLDDLLLFNRAGEQESNLSKEGIIEHYCLEDYAENIR